MLNIVFLEKNFHNSLNRILALSITFSSPSHHNSYRDRLTNEKAMCIKVTSTEETWKDSAIHVWSSVRPGSDEESVEHQNQQ